MSALQKATQSYAAEVDEEAARLVESGAFAPYDAIQEAHRRVQARRQAKQEQNPKWFTPRDIFDAR